MATGLSEIGGLYLGQYMNTSPSVVTDNLPAFHFQFSPSTNPLDTPVWQDITQYVIEFSFKRGRNFELDRFEASTASFTLDNTTRVFDPTNPNSPYYPNILPITKFQAYATLGRGIWYLFTGYIEEFVNTYEGPHWAQTECTAVDAFEALALSQLTGTFSSELAGTRITNALNAVSWPVTDRVIDPGVTTVAGVTYLVADNQQILSHIHEVEVGELGYVFTNGAGQIVFHDQSHRTTASQSIASQATFGDDAAVTELEYITLKPSHDKGKIYNTITVTASGSSNPQTVVNTASVARHLPRSIQLSTVLVNDAAALTCANTLLTRYANPILRIQEMTIQPLGASPNTPDPLWIQALMREIGDRVTVHRRPPDYSGNPGAMLNIDGYVELVEFKLHMGSLDAEITYELSPILPGGGGGGGSTAAYDTSVHAGGNGVNSLVLPGLTTAHANELILVATHGTGASGSISSITASGLTFVNVGQVNLGGSTGFVELWRAFASTTLSGTVITVNYTGSFPQCAAVASTYYNVDTTGSNGSGAVGATGTATGTSTAPSKAVTTTRANSLVAASLGFTSNASVTADSGQTLNATDTSTPGTSSTCTEERQNANTVSSGTAVTMSATLGATSIWGIISVEILSP